MQSSRIDSFNEADITRKIISSLIDALNEVRDHRTNKSSYEKIDIFKRKTLRIINDIYTDHGWPLNIDLELIKKNSKQHSTFNENEIAEGELIDTLAKLSASAEKCAQGIFFEHENKKDNEKVFNQLVSDIIITITVIAAFIAGLYLLPSIFLTIIAGVFLKIPLTALAIKIGMDVSIFAAIGMPIVVNSLASKIGNIVIERNADKNSEEFSKFQSKSFDDFAGIIKIECSKFIPILEKFKTLKEVKTEHLDYDRETRNASKIPQQEQDDPQDKVNHKTISKFSSANVESHKNKHVNAKQMQINAPSSLGDMQKFKSDIIKQKDNLKKTNGPYKTPSTNERS